MTSQTNNWKTWLQENWPNVRGVDHDWTMEGYDYPQYVRDGIMENWTKINDNNGGLWYETSYLETEYGTIENARKVIENVKAKNAKAENARKVIENAKADKIENEFQKFIDNVDKKKDDGKAFATAYKVAGFDAGMDDANKKGIDIMEKDGMKAAVKYMFTDQDSGRQLSYGEMRMRYG